MRFRRALIVCIAVALSAPTVAYSDDDLQSVEVEVRDAGVLAIEVQGSVGFDARWGQASDPQAFSIAVVNTTEAAWTVTVTGTDLIRAGDDQFIGRDRVWVEGVADGWANEVATASGSLDGPVVILTGEADAFGDVGLGGRLWVDLTGLSQGWGTYHGTLTYTIQAGSGDD